MIYPCHKCETASFSKLTFCCKWIEKIEKKSKRAHSVWKLLKNVSLYNIASEANYLNDIWIFAPKIDIFDNFGAKIQRAINTNRSNIVFSMKIQMRHFRSFSNAVPCVRWEAVDGVCHLAGAFKKTFFSMLSSCLRMHR